MAAATSLPEGERPGSLLANEEYLDFTREPFDAMEYANFIADAPEGSLYHGMDLPTALTKLSFNLDHLNKQIFEQVTHHYEDLIHQVTELDQLDSVMVRVQAGMASLNKSFDRLRVSVQQPYEQIRIRTLQVERLQATSELLRSTSRFLHLVRRMNAHMFGGDKEYSSAASSVCELESLLADCDIRGIDAIDAEIAGIDAVKKQLLSEGNRLIENGMTSQNQSEISAGLQIFHNLGSLGSKLVEVVDHLISDLSAAIQECLDVQLINQDSTVASAPSTGVRRVTEPGTVNPSAWSSALWSRLESLFDKIYISSVKIYLLERVLSRKRDAITQISFLKTVSERFDGDIFHYYWRSLAASMEREFRLSTKSSQNLQNALQNGYPKLLRLLHDLLLRIDVANGGIKGQGYIDSPEFALLSQTLHSFEASYLSRSLTRLLEPIQQAFPERLGSTPLVGVAVTGGSSKQVPSRDDIERLMRVVSSELEATKFDTRLLKLVGKNVSKALNLYIKKSELWSVKDSNAFSITGLITATQAQILNAEIANCLYALKEGLWAVVMSEYTEPGLLDIVGETVEETHALFQGIVGPLLIAVMRDIEGIIMKIHKEDFSKIVASSGLGRSESSVGTYIIELSNKIRWIQRELFARYQCGEERQDWMRLVGKRTVEFFLRHASIVPIASEPGKLRLAGDLTQLEFALNQWFSGTGMRLETDIGDCYRALKAFKPLLFLDLGQISTSKPISAIPPILLVHHLFTRAHPLIPLPTVFCHWSEQQYSEWLDAQEPKQAILLLEKCLGQYVDEANRKGEKEYCVVYPAIRMVINSALEA
ncbi:Golgi transport complex subunit 5-domain-containing protein [Polychytrium aggregatum]|uniref:Golgi transport complex subunit 5-domain-containing protein n=1 Tax=Polychytrium aggregatum TaxID=110093 RepID=UPI0022FEB934|nr:Golgi transport complex subunit 5-domain-containing protein [Polychytrium aggregatum]KAI9193313.1 Golgi transport complex subunit 5-domain-containing protein [Polychytrium aggregatum]